MTSQKKILANKRNAQESTGPKTEYGKARSRYNALKTGIHAIHRPLPGEDHKAYRHLTRRLLRRYAPTDPVEDLIVDQILGHIWRIQRLERAERAYLEKIQETRCKRMASLHLSRKPPTKRNLILSNDTAQALQSTNAAHLATCVCSQAQITDNLNGTFLEAAIGLYDTQPLSRLATQRMELMQEVIWLQLNLESGRKASFLQFTTENRSSEGKILPGKNGRTKPPRAITRHVSRI